jgi:hypothetical protein
LFSNDLAVRLPVPDGLWWPQQAPNTLMCSNGCKIMHSFAPSLFLLIKQHTILPLMLLLCAAVPLPGSWRPLP